MPSEFEDTKNKNHSFETLFELKDAFHIGKAGEKNV